MKPFDGKRLLAAAKKYQYALLILLAGLLLLAWPSGTGRSRDQPAAQSGEATEFDLDGLERRMERTLSTMEGVGKAEVVLTLASGSRRILAADRQQREDSTETETVILRSGSSEESAVTTQVLYPTFQGALVVCDGGNDAAVRLSVLKAVEALTGLRADNISICARTGGTSS